MEGKQIVAIDIGSSNVVIAVGNVENDGLVTIRGIVSEPVEGVNSGRIENSGLVSQAIVTAKNRIEQNLGIKISEAYAGLSGDFVRCVQVTDLVYVQDDLKNGSNQITQRDVDELDRRMKSVKLPDSQETIIAMEPLSYKVDNKEVAVPVGAFGHVLSATYNFILSDKAMSERLRHCLQQNGIKVKEMVPNAMIMHNSVATTDDMQDGAVIVDFGGGVTDVSVLYGGKVRYVASIPIGAMSINADIQTLAIPTSYIEDLKIQYGSAIASEAKDDIIVFQAPKRAQTKTILRKNLAIVIEARLKEIAEWIRREIKEAGCGSKFMPTLLLTGGGSQMTDIERLFARELDIQDARTVHPEYGFTEESMLEHITSPADATVASLLIYGATHGSCTTGPGPKQTTPTKQPEQQPEQRTTLSQYDQNARQQQTEQTTKSVQQQTNETTKPVQQPPKPKKSPYDDDDTELKPEKVTLGEKLRIFFTKAGNTFVGDPGEGDF